MPTLHFRSFLLLLVAVSIAFVSILLPFYPAIFWGSVLAVLFSPLYRWLHGILGNRYASLASFLTVLCIILIVIIPLLFIGASLANEAAGLYNRIRTGELNLGHYYEQIVAALPPVAHSWLESLGVGDLLSIREQLSSGALQGSQFLARQAVSIGQNTFQFVVGLAVMLYLLFFLLRDGPAIVPTLKRLIPLEDTHRHDLFQKFATVVRATVKGNIVIAATQGLLGGLMFAFLGIQGPLFWGVVMAFLSLLPAVGASLIWLPVAIYFLVTAAYWQGVVLMLFGVLVIGLIDNLLRPILVGKDAKLPDYVVLISTLGGLSVFGLNGFVIGPLFAALFMACWDLFPQAAAAHAQAIAAQKTGDTEALPDNAAEPPDAPGPPAGGSAPHETMYNR